VTPTYPAGRDAWLFLTPEIEREVPVLMDALSQARSEQELNRIEHLVTDGSIRSWFDYLRDCRQRLELAVAEGGDEEAARRLAAVLREQYLLVPALRPEEPADEPERRRLEELT
jgi:hypothetical protein